MCDVCVSDDVKTATARAGADINQINRAGAGAGASRE